VRDWCHNCHRSIRTSHGQLPPAQHYIEQAGGNEMAARQALYQDLVDRGMESQAAWNAAGQYINNHSMNTPGTTDMTQFENRPTTDEPGVVPEGKEWGPTDEWPDDFNPQHQNFMDAVQEGNKALENEQPDWEPLEDPMNPPEPVEPSPLDAAPQFESGQQVTTWKGDNGKIIGVDHQQGDQTMWRIETDDGRTMIVRQDKLTPGGTSVSQLPEFPEPTGATVPDTIPAEWG
jgi:hypothetical protein